MKRRRLETTAEAFANADRALRDFCLLLMEAPLRFAFRLFRQPFPYEAEYAAIRERLDDV